MERLLIAFPGQEQRTEEEELSEFPEQPLLRRILTPYNNLVKRIGDMKTSILFGNSFGIYAALVASGAMEMDDALKLAGKRGELVRRSEHEAEQEKYRALLREEDTTFMGRTGMVRFIGVSLEVRQKLENMYNLYLSNDYGPVVVLTGYKNVLDLAAKKIGRMATVLDIDGAYHSPIRAKDAEDFKKIVEITPINEPNRIIISSTNPRILRDPEDIREELVGMMTRPVIFKDILNLLIDLGVSRYLDLDPKESFRKLSGKFDEAREKLQSLGITEGALALR